MIVNGVKVEGTPKKVNVEVAGKMLKLNLSHIGENEVVEAEFKWIEAPEGFEISSKKLGNRISTTIKKGKQVLFEALSAQATYLVLEAAFGWTPNKSNGIYTKSNTTRKESQAKSKAEVTVTAKPGVGL